MVPPLLQAVAAAHAELADLKAKYGGLTRQYDEAVHKINLAKQVILAGGWSCPRDTACAAALVEARVHTVTPAILLRSD